METEALWKIRMVINEPLGVSLWKHIRSEWKKNSRFITFIVGNGIGICFWRDSWCWGMILNDAFLDLFRIAWAKEASLAHCMCWNIGDVRWNILLIGSWKSFDLFLIFLVPLISRGIEKTAYFALLLEVALFEVKFFYKVLSTRGSQSFPWKCILEGKGLHKRRFIYLLFLFKNLI